MIASLYGLTELLKRFWCWLLRPKGSPPAFFTLVLKEDIFKEQLRFAREYISWEQSSAFAGILVVDSYLSEQSKLEVKSIIQNIHNVINIKSIETAN